MSSQAFAEGERLPARCTADGEGVSPVLAWSGVPLGTETLALIVEDADAPTPEPIVHGLAWGLSLNGELPEGALDGEGAGGVTTGRNSYRKRGLLPPDPPSGHGPHRYVFQLFALGETPKLDGAPSKGDFLGRDPAAPAGRRAADRNLRAHLSASGASGIRLRRSTRDQQES